MRYLPVALTLVTLIAMQTAQAELRIFTCEPEWGALAKALGNGDVKVDSATSAGQDVHRIQARPGLISKMRRADLLVCSGADLEIGWLPLLLRQSGNRDVQVGKPGYFEASAFVERLEVPDKVSRVFGDVHPAGNPHVHLDPRRMLTIAAALNDRLQQLDPAHRKEYQQRYETFSTRMAGEIRKWEQRAAPLRGRKAVVHHKDWIYLFDWLGIEEIGTLEPKPGQPPTAGHLARLRKQLDAEHADFIIRAPYNDSRAAEWLHDKTGVPEVLLPFTVGGTDKAQDLFGLYDDTIDRLIRVPR